MSSCTFVDPGFLEGITVIRQLGKGVYGTVFLIRAADGNQYAVKYLDAAPDIIDGPGFQNILLDVDNLVRFRAASDDIIHLIGVCIQPDQIALIMEPMNYDLHRLSVIISLEQRLAVVPKLLLSMIRALTLFELLGINHFDIKPGNILVKGGDQPKFKLADFGLARPVLRKTSPVWDMRYTPGYRPPETLSHPDNSPTSGIDPRSDIWALGITIIAFIGGSKASFPPPYYQTDNIALMTIFDLTDRSYMMDWDTFVIKVKEGTISGTIKIDQIFKTTYPMIEQKLGPSVMDLITKMLSLNPNDRPLASQIAQQSFNLIIGPDYMEMFRSSVYPRKVDKLLISHIFKLADFDSPPLVMPKNKITVIVVSTEILTRFHHQVDQIHSPSESGSISLGDQIDNKILTVLAIFYIAAIYLGEDTNMDDIVLAVRRDFNAGEIIEKVIFVLTVISFQLYNTNLTFYINSIDESTFNLNEFIQSIPQWEI